jgi:hypothetical protein
MSTRGSDVAIRACPSLQKNHNAYQPNSEWCETEREYVLHGKKKSYSFYRKLAMPLAA